MRIRNVTLNIDRFATTNFACDPFEKLWNTMFQLLLQYKESHGHCNVPIDYQTPCGANLGIWLARQKRDNGNGKLDTVKVKRLEEAGLLF